MTQTRPHQTLVQRIALPWAVALTCATALLASPAWAVPGTLRYCAAGSPATFDPANSASGIDHIATEPVFAGLLEADAGTGKLMPALAERWSVAPDGRSYTFALRRGVQFHTTDWFKPTRAFNADDVLFTFARLLDPKHPFQQSYATLSPYVEALGWRKLVQRVERVGDYEVRIQLATVDASFLSPLTYAFAGIQSAEYGAQLLAQNKAAQISRLPVGTGPFIFKSYQQDSVLRYRRHPSYYRTDVPVVDQLVFAITIDRNVRTQRLLANECDIAVMSNPVELAELAKNPALALVSQPGLNVGFLAFNLKKPPLDRLDVRQALDMAIDKPTLVKTIFGNTGEVAVSPMPSANWAFDAAIKGVPYAPDKARELLKRAGVKDLQLTLWAMPVQRAYNPNPQQMAQMIQADWAKVGVTARIVSYEWGEYLKRIDAGDHDTALLGWGGDVDPVDTAGQLACGASSASFWCDKTYDQTIALAKQTMDQAQRKVLYGKAQRIAMANLPWSTLANGRVTVALRKNVSGFKLGADGGMRFEGVTLR